LHCVLQHAIVKTRRQRVSNHAIAALFLILQGI
jgi:hypothetical protein